MASLRSERRLFLAAVAGAVLVRLAFILTSNLPFESDEAIVGLMARHILYAGDRPIFYYGQQYMGPLEAVTAAISFALLGPSLVALRVAPMLWSVVLVGFSAAYARRAFGPAAFWFTLAYLAVPPLFLVTWSVKARGGYPELLAFGAILLYQTLGLVETPDGKPWRWLVFGALAGLGLWTNPLIVVFLAPVTGYLILHLRGRMARWTSPAAVGAAIVASAPMVIANARQPGVTLRQLAGPAVNQPITAHQLISNTGEAIKQSLPVVLGFFQGCSYRPMFFATRAASGIPFTPVAAGCFLVALIGGGLLAVSLVRAIVDRPTPLDLLLWVGALTMLPFILTQQQPDYVTEPRYLLPLYALVPVAAVYWAKLWRYRATVAAAVLGMILLFNVTGYLRFIPDLAGPFIDGQPVHTGDAALAQLLESQGVHTLYADYWLSYPIAFHSQEGVKTAVIDDHLGVGFNRYIPYAIAAVADPQPAILVITGSPTDTYLQAWLDEHRATYQVHHWENLTLYDHVTPRFAPVNG
ncbi:MAG TPA: glycosyltransferase family 39 protein [Chloroflexota bacterium]|nr:glycosyltransferase family 39 protein [Chloroflexota bacterium]